MGKPRVAVWVRVRRLASAPSHTAAILAPAATFTNIRLPAYGQNRQIQQGEAMNRPATLIFSLLSISIAAPALAQDRYPARPIPLAIPSVPAGGPDVNGRR